MIAGSACPAGRRGVPNGRALLLAHISLNTSSPISDGRLMSGDAVRLSDHALLLERLNAIRFEPERR